MNHTKQYIISSINCYYINLSDDEKTIQVKCTYKLYKAEEFGFSDIKELNGNLISK